MRMKKWRVGILCVRPGWRDIWRVGGTASAAPALVFPWWIDTVCSRSSDPFHIVSSYIKRGTTSWTYSTIDVGSVISKIRVQLVVTSRGNIVRGEFPKPNPKNIIIMRGYRVIQNTGWPRSYRKSVLHLRTHMSHFRLSRGSTDLR